MTIISWAVRFAEKLRQAGHDVTLVTPMATASSWTALTDEQFFVQKRLLEHGIKLVLLHGLKSHGAHEARLACVYTEREMVVPCETLVPGHGAGLLFRRLYFIRTWRAAIGHAHRRLSGAVVHCRCGVQRPSLCARIRRQQSPAPCSGVNVL